MAGVLDTARDDGHGPLASRAPIQVVPLEGLPFATLAPKFMLAMVIIMPNILTMNLGSGLPLASQLGNQNPSNPHPA